jgi:O-antigen/teichoic acid export membrane protein
MERVGRLTKNTAALVGARVATSGLTFLLAIVINRNLGPEKAGIYNYAFALYTIFQVLPDFGLGNISIRDISQEPSRMQRYFANIVSLRLLLGSLAFLLLMLTNLVSFAAQGSAAGAGEKFWVVFTIAFCLLVEQPLSNSLAENFIAMEKLILVAGVYLVMGIMKVGLSIWLVSAGFPHVLVLLVLVYLLTYVYSILHLYPPYRRLRRRLALAEGGGAAAMEALARPAKEVGEAASEALLVDYAYAELMGGTDGTADRPGQGTGTAEGAASLPPQPPPRGEPDFRLGFLMVEKPLWRYLLSGAWPLAVVAAGVTVYAGMDIPILSWFRGDAEVGLYGAAGMFAKAFVFLTLAVNMAVLPSISKVGGKHPERLGKIWEHLLGYAWFSIAFLAVTVPFLARPVLVLQKHDFIRAWHATWLTMGAMNFTFMTAISFPFFVVINRQRELTKVVMASLAIKGALDLVTIPIWGYTGAAATVLASEFLVFCVLARLLSRDLGHPLNPLRFAAPPLLVLATLYGAGFALYFALSAWRETFLASLRYSLLICSALVALYLGIGALTGAFSPRRLRELNRLLTVGEAG